MEKRIANHKKIDINGKYDSRSLWQKTGLAKIWQKFSFSLFSFFQS